MPNQLCVLVLLSFLSCKSKLAVFNDTLEPNTSAVATITPLISTDSSSWSYFLQHLPEKKAPVLDYTGQPVAYQEKHYSIINYDVGNRDLQQCADALMRLRAEYLFAQHRLNEIGFHFTSSDYYTFTNYCEGKRPIPDGNRIKYKSVVAVAPTSAALRAYLDIVYTYAGTISLAKELKPKEAFAIGHIIITPGSPGHCFIIADEATTASGEKLYKLVEGYTPAQSIYVLNNLEQPQLGYWHSLKKGTIETAGYEFTKYKIGGFE